tara:strand:+ start:75 stop:224 length:150 start_codon:yes stop_codon:yes gene_type:complete
MAKYAVDSSIKNGAEENERDIKNHNAANAPLEYQWFPPVDHGCTRPTQN